MELLQFIRKAQALGFTLSEVREIVEIRRKGQPPCVHVRALLEQKVADLDQRLKDLVALRKKLRQLLAHAGRPGPRRGRAAVCPHIESVPLEPKRRL